MALMEFLNIGSPRSANCEHGDPGILARVPSLAGITRIRFKGLAHGNLSFSKKSSPRNSEEHARFYESLQGDFGARGTTTMKKAPPQNKEGPLKIHLNC